MIPESALRGSPSNFFDQLLIEYGIPRIAGMREHRVVLWWAYWSANWNQPQR